MKQSIGISIVVSASIVLLSTAVNSEDLPSNPFNPLMTQGEERAEDAYPVDGESINNIHPLQRSPVTKYTLMGTLVSDKGKIAMIRGVAGKEYFVKIDDLLGNRGGKIEDITGRGIEVREEEKIIFIAVRNRNIGDEDESDK